MEMEMEKMEMKMEKMEIAGATRAAFSSLQPFCSRLLELPLHTGAHSDVAHSMLCSLRDAIAGAPLPGLCHCLEYVLFPLQLLLDAAVLCRKSPQTEKTIFIADKIAEGVLFCLEELLLRCPLTSKTQMNVLLRKFTATASLSTDEASEEIRHGAVKCLKTLMEGLRKCGKASCQCHPSDFPPQIVLGDGGLKADILPTSENTCEQRVEQTVHRHEECLIEFLQSETMSIAVGHLLSLLLQISETEALRGRIGSAKLRVDALATIRVLLVKVGSADALAFFLPGIASRLVKSVQSSKKMNSGMSELSYPSGAAGSSLAVEQALRALNELIVLVLADERNLNAIRRDKNSNHLTVKSLIGHEGGETALSMLHTERIRKKMQSINDKQTMQPEMNECNFQGITSESRKTDPVIPDDTEGVGKLRVERSEAWLEYTMKRISSLLSLCYPALCRHRSSLVRLAVTDGVAMLMITCRLTLESFMPTFLECLLAMACDERPHVTSAANSYLRFLTTEQVGVSKGFNDDIKKVICRLIERIPKALFSADESVILFHCRQLLAAMFSAGPDGVSECIFQSPAAITQFLNVMFQCFSFNTTLVGSLKQLNNGDNRAPGYVPGILELTTDEMGREVRNAGLPHSSSSSAESEIMPNRASKEVLEPKELPRMPPWFHQTVGCKLYNELGGILRLLGLASMLPSGSTTYIHILVEELLVPFRLAPDVHDESHRGLIGSGQWQRTAATMAAVLNEVFYGASGLWFNSSSSAPGLHYSKCTSDVSLPSWASWKNLVCNLPSKHLSECVGDILHEFMSDAIWKPPFPTDLDKASANKSMIQLHVHMLRDTASLQQVVIEGIGVLALSIGHLFEEEGFLRSVLYLLLEQLGCSHYPLSSAADISLRAVSSACGYPSVKDLIIASTDYIVDSLCRQLWHMDLHPNAPNMLVAVLSYVGAGKELVSLLQEPMRSIALQLEIPAREHSPECVVPMLRALREIVKAAMSEGACTLEEALSRSCVRLEPSYQPQPSSYDETISILKENERRRESIQDTLILCINSSSPLLASKDERKCLLALEIVEIGIAALACMEAVGKHAKEARESIRERLQDKDIPDMDEPNNPKLLPTMNKVWPHLVSCLKHTSPSVLVVALKAIANVVSKCGGEFFNRRFQKDATPMMLSLLCYEREPQPKARSQYRMLLPYQGSSPALQKDFALESRLKVQKAVFSCLAEIASNASSASALASSLEQLASVTVGFACGATPLQEAAIQAALALCNLDADFVWILVADIAFSGGSSMSKVTSPGEFFPDLSQLLPDVSSSSSEEALWKQLCNKDLALHTSTSQACTLLTKFDEVHK